MIWTVLRWVGFVVVLLAVAVIAVIRFREPPVRDIHFPTLALASTPNQYLVCPEDVCTHATPNATGPIFKLRPIELSQSFQRLQRVLPRTHLVRRSEDGLQITLIQRSMWMAYPDVVTIHFLPAGEGSTIAIYSRSVYGNRDFGVNKARVERWLEQLENHLAQGR